MIMMAQCGINNQQNSVSSITTCVAQKFETWRKTKMRSMVNKSCEESSLKLAYPRKLSECTDLTNACKDLVENWMNDAARLKRDCLNKK